MGETPEHTNYFSWRTMGGPLQHGDTLPAPTDPVVELIFNRCAQRLRENGLRPHQSHPIHEAAMRAELPHSLQVLRVDGCRLRTWPVHLPLRILEFYASGCDFFTIPDLSAYTEMIVLEMPDNRAESLTRPLPPQIARLSVASNALNTATVERPATLANASFINNPGLLHTLERERQAYKRACDAAVDEARQAAIMLGRDFDPAAVVYPPAPPSTLQPWIVESVAPAYYTHWMRPPRIVAAAAADRPIATVWAPRPVNAYKNNQNVHDSGIQDSTRTNLNYIANYKLNVPRNLDLLRDIGRTLNGDRSILQRICSLITTTTIEHPVVAALRERMETPYSMHGYTPGQVVDRLWLRIMDFPEPTRKEVLSRFSEEVLDGRAYCMNGFMVRMANVLIGFDENCVMQLRPAQIIQARIPATIKRLRDAAGLVEGAEPWTYWRDCTIQTWEDMEEVDMPAAEREPWLTPLLDPMMDELCKEPRRIRAEDKALDDALLKAASEAVRDDAKIAELRAAKDLLIPAFEQAIKEAIPAAKLNKPTKQEDGQDLAYYVEREMRVAC